MLPDADCVSLGLGLGELEADGVLLDEVEPDDELDTLEVLDDDDDGVHVRVGLGERLDEDDTLTLLLTETEGVHVEVRSGDLVLEKLTEGDLVDEGLPDVEVVVDGDLEPRSVLETDDETLGDAVLDKLMLAVFETTRDLEMNDENVCEGEPVLVCERTTL